MGKKRIQITLLVSFNLILSLTLSPQHFSSRNLTLKTTRYELDVKVDYETEKIFGKCQLTVNNSADQALSHVPLILYRLLKVNSVTDETGKDVPIIDYGTEDLTD